MRYNKQEKLANFGIQGQQKLGQASVLVVGAGGLGVPVLQYLNAMGIGTLGIIDGDVIELSNLHRQVLYAEKDLGQKKVLVAQKVLQAQNKQTTFKIFDHWLTGENALAICQKFDLIIDASDNFETRYLIDDVCFELRKPWVYGGVHGFQGQVSVFNHQQGPTYRCLFPESQALSAIPSCDEYGVLGILPGIIGNFQCLEAVKLIVGIPEILSGKLWIYDGLKNQVQTLQFKPNHSELEKRKLKKSYTIGKCNAPRTISAIEMVKKMEEPSFLLIDVRTPEEFDVFHLPKAINLDLTIENPLPEKYLFAKTIHLICAKGARSAQAQKKLQNLYPQIEFVTVMGGYSALKSSQVVR